MNSTRIKQGKFQVVDVTYNKNWTSNVTPISEWMPIREGLKENEIPTNAWLVSGTKYEHCFISEKR